MADQLYMNVDEANSTLLEMKEYIDGIEDLTDTLVNNFWSSLVEAKTWVSPASDQFFTLLSDHLLFHGLNLDVLNILVDELAKEIQQWEETSRQLGI